MNKLYKILLLLLITLITNSCSTIFSKSEYEVNIDSTPSQTPFVVKDRSGRHIAKGITPQKVTLKASDDFFVKQKYEITFNGFQEDPLFLDAKVDPTSYLNILFVPGFFIDAGNGSLFKLDSEVHKNLK